MAVKHPKSIALVLCEDIRKEEGGKLSLLGVLAGTVRVFPNEDGEYTLPQICLFGEFEKTGDQHDGHVEIIDPHGNLILKTDPARISGENNITMTLKVKNFVLSAPGAYTFNVFFGKKKTAARLQFELFKSDLDAPSKE